MDFLRKLFLKNKHEKSKTDTEKNNEKTDERNSHEDESKYLNETYKSDKKTNDKNTIESFIIKDKKTVSEDCIEELNNIRDIQNKLFKLSPEKRLSRIKIELGSDYLQSIKNLQKDIIKLCYNDKITRNDLEKLKDATDKKFILKQTNQHFGKKEAFAFLSDKIHEVVLTDADVFRNLCEGFLDDGVLTPSEESELRLEKNYLNNLTDEEADKILDEVKKEKQKHSLDDLLKKEIEKFKKQTFTLDEILDIFILNDKYQIEEEDIRITLLTSLRGYVNFDRSTNKFTLSKTLDNNKPKGFEFNNTNYEVIIIEEEDPFILQFTNTPKPQDKSCLISINKLNAYFADKNFDKVAIRDVIYDAVVADLLTKIPNVQPHEFVQHKNKVVKNLNLDVFLNKLLS